MAEATVWLLLIFCIGVALGRGYPEIVFDQFSPRWRTMSYVLWLVFLTGGAICGAIGLWSK